MRERVELAGVGEPSASLPRARKRIERKGSKERRTADEVHDAREVPRLLDRQGYQNAESAKRSLKVRRFGAGAANRYRGDRRRGPWGRLGPSSRPGRRPTPDANRIGCEDQGGARMTRLAHDRPPPDANAARNDPMNGVIWPPPPAALRRSRRLDPATSRSACVSPPPSARATRPIHRRKRPSWSGRRR